jgi:hypothetical protein
MSPHPRVPLDVMIRKHPKATISSSGSPDVHAMVHFWLVSYIWFIHVMKRRLVGTFVNDELQRV